VIDHVKKHGDRALFDYANRFDKVELTKLYLDKTELEELASTVSEDQQEALQTAYANIYKFHKAQLKARRQGRNHARRNLLARIKAY
jgi:histidinol dehydrogenase